MPTGPKQKHRLTAKGMAMRQWLHDAPQGPRNP